MVNKDDSLIYPMMSFSLRLS